MRNCTDMQNDSSGSLRIQAPLLPSIVICYNGDYIFTVFSFYSSVSCAIYLIIQHFTAKNPCILSTNIYTHLLALILFSVINILRVIPSGWFTMNSPSVHVKVIKRFFEKSQKNSAYLYISHV